MKFKDIHGESIVMTWSDHYQGCPSCRTVEVEKSATFSQTCVLGSQLLIEKLAQMRSEERRVGKEC